MSAILSLRHYHDEVLAHSHDHAQLVFGLRGCLQMELDGRQQQVQRQDLSVIPVAAHHACASNRGSDCLVLDVPDEDWLREALGPHFDPGRRLLENPALLQLAPAQSQLVGWIAQAALQDALIAGQAARLLLASLAAPQAEPAQGLPLAALDAHIDRQLASPLQVADLARLCGLSVARFHARFISETGQTPMDYVRKRRLRRARQLLQHCALPIGEIAAQVGYASQSAFSAAIAREFGRSPRTLRQQCE